MAVRDSVDIFDNLFESSANIVESNYWLIAIAVILYSSRALYGKVNLSRSTWSISGNNAENDQSRKRKSLIQSSRMMATRH